VQKPVLVEDTSLTFSALGKLPGTLIKWFLQELGNEGLCQLLDNQIDRIAVAEVLYGLYDGKTVYTFEGKVTGTISKSPKGNYNFGWGKIFIPDGYTQTLGEIEPEEQKKVAYRVIALEKLEKYLKTNED
jgi:inosine triphosphate pyrophosphatase